MNEDIYKQLEDKLSKDIYFFDIRFWEKSVNIKEEVDLILKGKSNNSGHVCGFIRENKLEAEKVTEIVTRLMYEGLKKMKRVWETSLVGIYLKTYGENSFKKVYGYYLDCCIFMGVKEEAYDTFYNKAKLEVKEIIETKMNNKLKEIQELVIEKNKFGII